MRHCLWIMAGLMLLSPAHAQEPDLSGLTPASADGMPPLPAAAPTLPVMPPLPGVLSVPEQAIPALPASTPISEERGRRYVSLLFNGGEMERINGAVQIYRLNTLHGGGGDQAAEDFVNALQAETPQQIQKLQQVEHPQFYMEALTHRGEKEWAVWINQHRYSDENPRFGELTVQKVDIQANRVWCVWKPKMFALYPDRLPRGTSADRIAINEKERIISFMLYPNQSFSSYSMTVEEGYLPPVKIEHFTTEANVDAEGAAATEITVSPEAPAAPAPPKESTDEIKKKRELPNMPKAVISKLPAIPKPSHAPAVGH